MNIIIFISILIFFTLLLILFSIQKKDTNIFKDLDKKLIEKKRGSNNEEKAEIFEKIYFDNYTNDNFHDLLINYINDIDKAYWIGVYLSSDYYTKINNIDLSIEVFKKGITLCNNEEQTVSFYWQIGYNYFFNNKKDESKKFLINAYNLSIKYPGHRPALTREQHIEINNFIGIKYD